jgi:hypothetical protein
VHFVKYIKSLAKENIFVQYQVASEFHLHRKKFTTGLVELAAVMATEKVSKKRQKLFRISYKKNA